MSNEIIKAEEGEFEILNLTETAGTEITIQVRVRGFLFERFSYKHLPHIPIWKVIHELLEDEPTEIIPEYQAQLEAMFRANISKDVARQLNLSANIVND